MKTGANRHHWLFHTYLRVRLYFLHCPTFYPGLIKKKIKKSGILPNVIFDNLNSNLGQRIAKVLGSLFPPASLTSKRIVTFTGFKGVILFGHYWNEKTGYSKKNYILQKLSPSFDLQPFKITLDTINKKNQKIEWVLTPFLNSKKKKNFLSSDFF